MNEFIEKLIGRLEEEIEWAKSHGTEEMFRKGRISGLNTAKRISNQIAEEYNKESVKTNADYIRNMTNDELTTFLSSIDHITDEGDRLVVFEGEAMHDNIVDIEIWLKDEKETKGE